MEFIASENVELLWEIIMEEDIVKVIPKNRTYEFRQFYIGQIKQYSEYVVGRNTNIPLVKINQDFITGFIKKIQPAPQQQQQQQQSQPKTKELYTAEEIQTDKRSQFESELTRKQNEFKNAMTVPVPEIPKFGDQLDKPIGSAMDELIAKTLAERNYDVQMIQKQNANPNGIANVEQFLKGQETSVKAAKPGYNPTPSVTQQQQNQIKYIKIGDDVDDNALKTTNVIDLSSPKLERQDKKNVSWGNNEYQEYTQQNTVENQNTLFSKLKYITPNNNEVEGLKSEINDLKTQIRIINDKFDKLISKFTQQT
jgi:hypothetical protein